MFPGKASTGISSPGRWIYPAVTDVGSQGKGRLWAREESWEVPKVPISLPLTPCLTKRLFCPQRGTGQALTSLGCNV